MKSPSGVGSVYDNQKIGRTSENRRQSELGYINTCGVVVAEKVLK